MLPSSQPSVIDSQIACESGCYQQGESIVSWLNRISSDINTQCKKSHILDMLAAENYDAQTLIDVGDHVNTPVEVHLVLSTHEDADLRFALAENHNLHESVLNFLVEDSNPYVAHRARMTLAAHPANLQAGRDIDTDPAALDAVEALRQEGLTPQNPTAGQSRAAVGYNRSRQTRTVDSSSLIVPTAGLNI